MIERQVAHHVHEKIKDYAVARGIQISFVPDPRGWLTVGIQPRLNALLHHVNELRGSMYEAIRIHNEIHEGPDWFEYLLIGLNVPREGFFRTLFTISAKVVQDTARGVQLNSEAAQLNAQLELQVQGVESELIHLRAITDSAAREYWNEQIQIGCAEIDNIAFYERALQGRISDSDRRRYYFMAGSIAVAVVFVIIFAALWLSLHHS